jgi:hypothetical protein
MKLLLSLNILKSGVIILNVDNGFYILERFEKNEDLRQKEFLEAM